MPGPSFFEEKHEAISTKPLLTGRTPPEDKSWDEESIDAKIKEGDIFLWYNPIKPSGITLTYKINGMHKQCYGYLEEDGKIRIENADAIKVIKDASPESIHINKNVRRDIERTLMRLVAYELRDLLLQAKHINEPWNKKKSATKLQADEIAVRPSESSPGMITVDFIPEGNGKQIHSYLCEVGQSGEIYPPTIDAIKDLVKKVSLTLPKKIHIDRATYKDIIDADIDTYLDNILDGDSDSDFSDDSDFDGVDFNKSH